jgi:hypothetical protein
MHYQKTIFAVLLAAGTASTLLVTPLAQAQRHAPADVWIGTAPPPPRYEAAPPPRRGYVWVAGYWAWNGHRHIWAPGHWERIRHGYRYAPPGWHQGPRGWHQDPGGWQR